MKTKFKLILAGIAGCLVVLYFTALASQEKAELKFSHKLHVVENEMDCSSCHANAAESTSGTDNLMPSMETCGNCHDVEDSETCSTCHSDMDNPRAVPRVEHYSELFSHKKHLAAGLECETCHAEVAKQETVEPYILPDMADCVTCHQNRNVSTECRTCHKPSENLKPVTHGPDFLHIHGDQARMSATAQTTVQNCNLCHTKNYCQKCHEGDNLDRTTHPLNYTFTHPLDARGKEKDCAVCHTDRSFCYSCHVQYQVMPHNHTPGWANRIPGDGGRHRFEAQNDLGSCMACHEQNAQQVCETCHSK